MAPRAADERSGDSGRRRSPTRTRSTTSRATSPAAAPTPRTSCRRPTRGPCGRGAVRARHEPQGLALPHPAQYVAQPGAPPRRSIPRSAGSTRWNPPIEADQWRRSATTSSSTACASWSPRRSSAALMPLTEEARTIVLLDLEGLTEGDVAAVVGCAVGTVKSRLARARQALRRQLRDYAPMNGTPPWTARGAPGSPARRSARAPRSRSRRPLATHLDGCAACAREDTVERVLTEQLERQPAAARSTAGPETPTGHPVGAPRAGRCRASAPGGGRPWRRSSSSAALPSRSGSTRRARPGPTAWWRRRSPITSASWPAAEPLDVRSGDMHEVRPWLTARLDFAPVIPFAGDADFPLRGGTARVRARSPRRRRRLRAPPSRHHAARDGPLDGLAWPAAGRPLATSTRGFNVRLWQASGLGYALVSDVDEAELARLASRLGG